MWEVGGRFKKERTYVYVWLIPDDVWQKPTQSYKAMILQNISPAQVGCMRQALGPGAQGRPGGSGWRGRWEGGSGSRRHVNSRPFHFNV